MMTKNESLLSNAANLLQRYAGGRQARAYDAVTEWRGPVRETVEAAERDAERHNAGCAAQGGYGSAIVVVPDPDCEGRCVTLDGATVWPPHGRGSGSVRWR